MALRLSSNRHAPYLVCSPKTYPAHAVGKVSIAGDWRDDTHVGVGPCDRKWATFVVVRDPGTHQAESQEQYEHPSIVTGSSDFEICVQLPQPNSNLRIQDILRFFVTQGNRHEYEARLDLANCPIK